MSTEIPDEDTEPATKAQTAQVVRAGWAESLATMHANGDDALILGEGMATAFDEEEWEWEIDPQTKFECQLR